MIVDNFDAITWDIRFSNMYNENSSYLRQIEKVRNIHIHAELLGGEWFLDNSGVDDVLGETVSDIIEKLPVSCNSIITLESVPKDSEWNDFKRSRGVLRKAMTNKGPIS